MLGVAVLGRFYQCRYTFASQKKATIGGFSVGAGLLYYFETRQVQITDWTLLKPWEWNRIDRWHWGLAGEDMLPDARDGWNAGTLYMATSSMLWVGVSVVYPVLLTTIPAAFFWYKDRRRFGPHQCKKCGYDRGGLDPNAKCPECGTVSGK
jgi:hypothetical protein